MAKGKPLETESASPLSDVLCSEFEHKFRVRGSVFGGPTASGYARWRPGH